MLFIVAQSCPTLRQPLNCSPPGSFLLGVSQARILEGVAISFSRESSWTRDWTHVFCISCIGRRIIYHQDHLGSPLQLRKDTKLKDSEVQSQKLWIFFFSRLIRLRKYSLLLLFIFLHFHLWLQLLCTVYVTHLIKSCDLSHIQEFSHFVAFPLSQMYSQTWFWNVVSEW